jgi:hypothetical protein
MALERHGRRTAWQENGMAGERHGMGTAWQENGMAGERHGLCESAFRVFVNGVLGEVLGSKGGGSDRRQEKTAKLTDL